MTLNQPTRVALGRLLAHLRDDWHDAGVHDAAAKLAGMDGTPFQLCSQAIVQASNAANRTPEAICWPVKRDATKPLVVPRVRDACPIHDVEGYTKEGERVCCWQDKHITDPTPFRRTGTHGPPPAVKAKIEEMRRG